MKKGFSLVEIIISISLVSAVALFALVIIKKAEPTYADPYENIRTILSDATNLFLNTTAGTDYRETLYSEKELMLNTNILIQAGLIEESYFVENTNENKSVKNIEIVITLDDEGLQNYSINII